MLVKNRINADKSEIEGLLKSQGDILVAKAFEDGTKAGLNIAIKQLEMIRDSISISDVIEEAKR